ncbi:hypothetical protein V6615_02410 [Oscillospiraceae bacterium PP1C4]
MCNVLRAASLSLAVTVLFTACYHKKHQPIEAPSEPLQNVSAAAASLPSAKEKLPENPKLANAVSALRNSNPNKTTVDWGNLVKGQSLALTEGLLGKIADILTKDSCAAEPALPDVIDFKDSVMLNLDTETKQKYNWISMDIYLLSDIPSNGASADKMLLELSSGTGDSATFLFEKLTFNKIIDVLSASSSNVPLTVNGTHVEMKMSCLEGMQFPILSSCLQFDDMILCGWSLSNDGIAESPFEAFDAKTGESLYTFTLPECPHRVEKVSMGVYDYRLVLADRILYKNSADVAVEKIWQLPEVITPKLWTDMYNENAFDADLDANLLAYATQEGIYLAQTDASGTKLVLSNNSLMDMLKSIDIPQDLNPKIRYVHPVLMNGGKQLVATIVYWSDGNEDYASYGLGIFDIESGKVKRIPDIFAWLSGSARPLDEKTVNAIGGSGMQLINVETGEYQTVEFNFHQEISFDYRTSAYTESSRDEQGIQSWQLCLRGKQGEYKQLLTVTSEYLIAEGITRDNIVCRYKQSGEGEKMHYLIVPLK